MKKNVQLEKLSDDYSPGLVPDSKIKENYTDRVGLNMADDLKTETNRATGFDDDSKMGEFELDVRPILEGGKDPLKLIMLKINQLGDGQALKIINSFEPLPLKNLLGKKGYESHTKIIDSNLVYTWFFKRTVVQKQAGEAPAKRAPLEANFQDLLTSFAGNLLMLDVSTLEMPKPMLAILDELEKLGEGEALLVRHKKVPVYLLPHLRDKGFHYLITEDDAAEVSILIFKE